MPDQADDDAEVTESQAYFWTDAWQEGEKLADLDRRSGNYYKPADVDDLIVWLNDGE